MEVNPIIMKRIYQSIIEQFIQKIKKGELKIGQKLPPERTLSEMFNVSRASVREAFRAMEIIGLIEVCAGGGTYITGLNIANFINTIAPLFVKNDSMERDLLEFRKLIELEAVRLASEKDSNAGNKALEEAISLMKTAVNTDDTNLGAEADIKFHKAIFELTDNYILIKAAECVAFILESSVRFNRGKILKDPNNSKELINQHLKIYNAIIQKDTQLAMETMRKHLSFVQEIV